MATAVPWLMLPPEGEGEGDRECSKRGGYRYFDVESRSVHELDNVPEDLSESCCIGSSHGWLIFLDQRAVPLLYNPFLLVQVELPCIDSLLGILKVEKSDDGEYRIKYDYRKNPIRYTKNLRESLVLKAIMSSDPCFGFNKFGAVVIHGYKRKLAYSNCADDSWTDLDCKHQPYDDIIISSSQNKLFALGNNASIEIWDFDGLNIPVKRAEMKLSYPEKSLKFLRDFRNLYCPRFYLVETKGAIMLVVRFVGELVNEDDEAVREEDLLSEEHTHPLVCPYKTLLFHVYKLDFDKKKWMVVDSLGDQTLFLGGNHSLSVSVGSDDSVVCKRNSIYFTDDYWDRMHEDYLYGGHDMGVFSLEDHSVKSVCQCPSLKIQPPPSWINTPSPW